MNLRGVRTRDGEDAIAFVLEHAGVQDRAYLESLGRCLELLGRKEDAARLGTVARSLPQLPSPDVKDEWT
jgi:hypothetical protein